jgi:phosphoribosylglycinamide formyltransferase-1
VPVLPGDTQAALSERVLTQEHAIYPLAVDWFCQGRLRWAAGKAWLDGKALQQPVQLADLVRESSV